MSNSEKLSFQIRAKLKEHGVDASVLKFGEAKLKTGELLVWEGDSLAQGVAIMIETPQGLLPAPDGVHELEDGSMVEVAGGIVTAVKMPDAPADPAAPAPAVDQTTENPAAQPVKSVVESVIKETRFSKEDAEELIKDKADKTELEAKFSEQSKTISNLETKIEEFTAQLSAMLKLVEILAEKPAIEPVNEVKTGVQFSKEDSDAKVNALLEFTRKQVKQVPTIKN